MPAVGIDQNALPLLFGEAEIGDAGGEHGLLLPLPRETDEFPAHGDKAVIRLFFVAFYCNFLSQLFIAAFLSQCFVAR